MIELAYGPYLVTYQLRDKDDEVQELVERVTAQDPEEAETIVQDLYPGCAIISCEGDQGV